jgi:3-methylfumaryl-CoA hydratase
MSTEIETLKQWEGRTTAVEDVLSSRHARLMAATIGESGDALTRGAALPPLWHWIYFLEGLPPEQLGRDGHPVRGGFLPPVSLPNRMWAGGDVHFHRALSLDAPVERRSRILSVDAKSGRSGDLVFVKVLHEVHEGGELCVAETHDIVYTAPRTPGARPAGASMEMPAARHSAPFHPTSTMLFRYSALTFNGHRIHYDLDYCRNVEHYEQLVVHGPLCATVLARFAQTIKGRSPRRFRYRGIQPCLLGMQVTLQASEPADNELTLWVALADGSPSMVANAYFD